MFDCYCIAELLALWETTNQNNDHAQHVKFKNTALLPKRKRHMLATKHTVHIRSHLVITVNNKYAALHLGAILLPSRAPPFSLESEEPWKFRSTDRTAAHQETEQTELDCETFGY